jgi:hypothetical protein
MSCIGATLQVRTLMLWLISFWKKINETVTQLGMNTSEAKARESASLNFQVDAGSNPASLTNA